MTLRNKILKPLHAMSITTRFALGIGLLLSLIVTVALTGYLSIFFVRSANQAIEASTEIQRMVLDMARGMERARRLHADFYLQYPAIGLAAAHERYAQPSIRQIAKVIAVSHDLKTLISQSPVSEALLRSQVDMNLYLSSAKRFADTSIQSVELVTQLAAPGRGLESQLDQQMEDLKTRLAAHDADDLYAQMHAYVKDYRISRERYLMQSAFNTAFQIRGAIDRSEDIRAMQKQAIKKLLVQFGLTAESIMAVDVAIKSKFNDFAIQANAVAPISAALIELANNEVRITQSRIAWANKVAFIIMAVITMAGLVLAVYIGRGLNNNITKRVVRLTASAGELRAGNLNAIAEDHGQDELSELGRTFNVMAARIRSSVKELELEVVKRTEELVESEGRFRDLFEHSASGVAVYRPVDEDRDFIIQDFNRAAETFEHVKREEIIGKRVTEVFPTIEKFGLLDVFRRVARTGQSEQHPVSYYSDGRLSGWRENAVYKLPSGEIVAVYEDRTAQKQAEIEKNAIERQLQHALKMEAIGVLAGGIAHDFNNILGIILGNLELAIEDIAPSHPVTKNLKEIRLAGLRAKDVIRQLLSFSRKTEPLKRPISIIPVIEESLSLMRASIPANIEITKDVAEDCGTIVADQTQIHQVIINLCTNAAHAMDQKGGVLNVGAKKIRINETDTESANTLAPGPYLQLAVRDTGEGMNPEIKERIFDPYFTTKEVGKGSGMGLSVVHGIVKNHDGIIRLESETGKGSKFTILLPAVDAPVTGTPDEPKSVIGGNERILLIDDEISLLKSISLYLQRLGYHVQSYTDPEVALGLFHANPHDFDIVITDLAMPKITGVDLIRKMLPIRSDMPIILCSGYSDAINGKEAWHLGVNRYVEKPVKLKDLATYIREVLDNTG